MARALIVGCGCHGRELAAALHEQGWAVRGTSRTAAGAAAIEGAGVEAAICDPDRIATVLDAIEGVSVIYWLLGTATGEPEALEALHGPRLERLLEEIVDTPVRGLVYEASFDLGPAHSSAALEVMVRARATWRIAFEVVDADRAHGSTWLDGMVAAGHDLLR